MISWPILIKFYMYHQWDGGKAALRLWLPWQQKAPIDLWGKRCLHANAFSFDPIFVKLAGNEDRRKILDELELTAPFGVRCP